MSDVSTAATPAADTPFTPVPGGISIEQAVKQYEQRQQAPAPAAEPAAPPAERPRQSNGQFARQESAPPEHDAAPATEQPSGENDGAEPAEELPPIKPPKFWDAARKEAFASLPRDVQEYVHERESARDTETSRARNEAAQARQAAEAARQQAEQERSRYEQALQANLQSLTSTGEFSDIRTHQDVQRMAEEDPFRFAKWQAHQMQVQGVQSALQEQERQRQQDYQKRLTQWSADQDKLFVEKAPEYADEKTASKARQDTLKYLTEVRDIPEAQIPELWNNPLFRDAKMQLIVRDAVKWHNAQEAAKKAAKQSVPPVQRPGTAKTTSVGQAEVEAAQARFDKLPNLANASALREAKRAAGLTK